MKYYKNFTNQKKAYTYKSMSFYFKKIFHKWQNFMILYSENT